jgi:circadian clock protein KaiC
MSNAKPEIDTAYAKQATGITGLDDLLEGGIPGRRITLVHGGPGTGKTILAMQALLNHVKNGGTGVVVAFEEQPDELVENLRGFDWDLDPSPSDRLHYVDARLDEYQFSGGEFDISGLLATAEGALRGADNGWLVLDGLDMLLRILAQSHRQRQELYRLKRWVRDRGYTAWITTKAEAAAGDWSSDFVHYASDCMIELHSTVEERVFTRSMRVVKYRGSSFVTSEFPYIIWNAGFDVPYRGSTELDHAVSAERVSTGVDRLDTLVGGGYMRGTSILISGAPGTSKTTLSAAFLSAATERGEKGLFVSFDESAEQIRLNARSVGIDLDRAHEAGLLRQMGFRAGNASAEEHYARILDVIESFGPRCLVLDPISALQKGGGRMVADTVAGRLLDYAKTRGITTIFTSLLHIESNSGEDTESQISTLADTWINLTYESFEGERNRALSIVKSRGSAHSNQVRELVLSDDGIELRDVYTAGGAVLMGTARMEREAENRAREAQRAMEYRIEHERIQAEIQDSEDRLQELERQLAYRRRRLELLEEQRRSRGERDEDVESAVHQSRRADMQDPGVDRS